jgi:hypothetical protein
MLTLKNEFAMKSIRIRGAVLKVERLCRLSPLRGPSDSRMTTGKFSDYFYCQPKFGVKNERDICASVRRCFNGHSSETNAPANHRFSRQRAGSRSRNHGYVLVLFSSSRKALGISKEWTS